MITRYELYLESIKQGKQYVEQGKIDQDTFEKIKTIDISKTKKFVGWLTKQYIREPYDIESLKSYIEEYVVLSDRKLINTDINRFKSIVDFKHQIDNVNNTKSATRKELETDYDTIVDNDDLLLIRPNSYEASRKLGLTVFKHRNNEKTGHQDSAWCTTYSNREHWDDYFYDNNVTFYYGKIKNKNTLKTLNWYYKDFDIDLNVFAIAVLENGDLDIYDANDKSIFNTEILIDYLKISKYLKSHINKEERANEYNKQIIKLFEQEIIDGDVIIGFEIPNNIKCNTKKINGNVRININYIPSFFNNIIINGNFSCNNINLSSLNGAPQIITGDFECNHNNLFTLEGAPQEVGGNFSCYHNNLKTLKGAPSNTVKHFYCNHNVLITLEGAPQKLKGNFYCYSNKLTSLVGAPSYVGGSFSCENNKKNFTIEEVRENINIVGKIFV